MGSSAGQMAGAIKGSGKMASKMEEVFIETNRELRERVSGQTERK